MPTSIDDRPVRASSVLLSALLLALSVAVPFMERVNLSNEERWESRHDADACTRAHDHTICTQVSAKLWIPASRPAGTRSALTGVLASSFSDDGQAIQSPRPEANPTRAPPKV